MEKKKKWMSQGCILELELIELTEGLGWGVGWEEGN